MVAGLGMLGCGKESRPVADQWNAICRDAARERIANKLVTATDFRRFVDSGHRTLKRLRGVARDSELDARQREALSAFAAQRTLERRLLAETQRRALVEVLLDFRKPADALDARVRRTFKAAGARQCARYPYLR